MTILKAWKLNNELIISWKDGVINLNTLETLYHLMNIKAKIPNEPIRYLYLRNVWGMEQAMIGLCEGKSQGYVSTALKQANATVPDQSFKDNTANLFTAEEIKNIQFLPRDIIGDVQFIAFVNDILQLEIIHPFFQFYTYKTNTRITALSNMGVRQIRLQEIFKKSQSSISMLVKRLKDSVDKYEQESRYDNTAEYRLVVKSIVVPNKFIPAGGQVW
jgi:hypothetical protein